MSGAAPKGLAGPKPQTPTGKAGGAPAFGKPAAPFKGAGAAPKGKPAAPMANTPMRKASGRGR